MSVRAYFGSACTFVSSSASAVVDTVSNISQEDVVAAANKAKAAALNVMQKASTAFNCFPQVPSEAARDLDSNAVVVLGDNDEWVEVEPGAPGGLNKEAPQQLNRKDKQD